MVDTNVLIAAAGWPRWPYEVIAHSQRGDFQLVLAPIITEQAHAFTSPKYPQVAKQIKNLTAQLIYEQVPDPSPAQVERNQKPLCHRRSKRHRSASSFSIVGASLISPTLKRQAILSCGRYSLRERNNAIHHNVRHNVLF